MTKYELFIEANGYEGVAKLGEILSISLSDAGGGYINTSTLRIGDGGAIVTVNSILTGSGCRINITSTGFAGSISTFTIFAAGSGYHINDVISVGSGSAQMRVTSVDISGGITGLTLTSGGSGYTLSVQNTTAISGSINTFTLTTNSADYANDQLYTSTRLTGSGTGATFYIFSNAGRIYTQKLDCNNANINITYNVADIKDISVKKSSFSKTITLPDTKVNRSVFQFIYGINSDSTFDVTKKSKCYVLKDSVIQFEGHLQITNIIYDRNNNSTSYECLIYDEVNNFFTNMGEKLLTDLVLDRFNHIYSTQSIINSWDNDYNSGYYYPLIDYGAAMSSSYSVSRNDMLPGLYLKPVVDQIFNEAGISYTSDFFNSDFFKNLILPANGKDLQRNALITEPNTFSSDTIIYSGKVTSTQSANIAYGSGNSFGNFYFNEIIDVRNLYNTSTYSYTNKLYSSTLTTYLDIIYTDYSVSTDYLKVNFKRNVKSDGTTVSNWSNTPNGFFAVENGYDDICSFTLSTALGYLYPGFTTSVFGGGMSRITGTASFNIDYRSDLDGNNEEVKFFFIRGIINDFHVTNVTANSSITIRTNDSSSNWILNGNGVNYANNLPSGIKQKDFMGSLAKMFNLYFDVDKLNKNNLLIEPRDDYYRKYQNIKDWSNKLDVSKPISSQITSNTQKKLNTFTYKEDKDILNKDYTEISNTIYGEYKWTIDNDFISDEQKTQLIFSPTPIDKLFGSNEIYLPIIQSNNNNGNSSGNSGMNIRILYKNKLPLTTDRFIFNGVTYSFYPYAGPFDNPTQPNISLNFGKVNSFYSGFTDTTNNLFYNYYLNQMLELGDKNSRIITAEFYLDAVDIAQFRFSDLIFCKINDTDGYYRVNKISDYDPSINSTTKVELVKALNTYIPKNQEYVISQTERPISITQTLRTGVINTSNTNNINANNVLVAGRNSNVNQPNNIIAGDNVNSIGSNNILIGSNISASGSNVMTVGSNNTILGDNVVTVGKNHIIEGPNNIVLGGESHTINGNKNVILGYGQGITVDSDTLAFTTATEKITYYGQPTYSVIETYTVATYSGIGYSIDGLGRIPLVFVNDLNNNQVGNGIRETNFYISFYSLGTTYGGSGREVLFSLSLTDLFSIYNGAGSYYISMKIVGSGGSSSPTGFFSGLLEYTLFFNGSSIVDSLLQQYYYDLNGWTSGFSPNDIKVYASIGSDTFYLFLWDISAGANRPTYNTTWGVKTNITYMPF